MIRAILRAQLLTMRIGAGRGRIFTAITGAIWYGIWVVVAAGVYAGAVYSDRNAIDGALPLGFLAVCAYWQLIPVLSASMGAGLDMRKLLVYPAPHRALFLVEVM